MSQHALVVGGSGAVGPALVKQLLVRGWHVRTYSRASGEIRFSGTGFEHRCGDVRDAAAVARAMRGIDVVFHLAARLHEHSAGPAEVHDMRSVNVDGTKIVARAARAAAVQRFVYFSSINIYGPTCGVGVAREDTPPAPATQYAQSKLDAERAVTASAVPYVVLRPAAVYGPAVQGGYAPLVRAIRGGYFVFVGDGSNRRTLVYIDDLVQAAIAAATEPAAVGRTFNVTDGHIHQLHEIIAAIAMASGRRVPRWSVPQAIVRCPLNVIAGVSGLNGIGKRALSLVDKFTEDIAVSGQLLTQVLHFKPTIELIDGWRRIIHTLTGTSSSATAR